MRATASRSIPRLHLSRDRARRASSERLYGEGYTSAFRGGGSVGIRSNPMATMTMQCSALVRAPRGLPARHHFGVRRVVLLVSDVEASGADRTERRLSPAAR